MITRWSGCKQPAQIPEAALSEEGFQAEDIPKLPLFQPNHSGCPKCNRGYKGRVGIYEMMQMTTEIAETIMQNGNSLDILRTAREQGFKTLRESGLRKVAEGLTSLEEMNRVIKT